MAHLVRWIAGIVGSLLRGAAAALTRRAQRSASTAAPSLGPRASSPPGCMRAGSPRSQGANAVSDGGAAATCPALRAFTSRPLLPMLGGGEKAGRGWAGAAMSGVPP